MAGDSRTRHHIRFVCNIIVRWSVSHSIETPTEDRNGRKEKDIPCHFISVKLKKKSRPSKNLCTSSSSGWRTFFPRLLLLWPLLLFGGKQDASGVAGPPRDGALFFDTLLPKEKNSWLDFKCAFDREKNPSVWAWNIAPDKANRLFVWGQREKSQDADRYVTTCLTFRFSGNKRRRMTANAAFSVSASSARLAACQWPVTCGQTRSSSAVVSNFVACVHCVWAGSSSMKQEWMKRRNH